MKKILGSLLIICAFFNANQVLAIDNLEKVNGIVIHGLVHVSSQDVTDVLAIKRHHVLTAEQLSDSVKALYKTGYFDNVQITQKNGVVSVDLNERLYVNQIEFEGVKLIPEDKLKEIQNDLHLINASFYDEAHVNKFKVSLKLLYDAMGYYNARIDIIKMPMKNHSMNVLIKVKEGGQAKIRQINIIGNQAFSEKQLLSLLALHQSNFWSMITSNDKYAKQKLDADLETLRSYYMNRGYIKFNVDSVAVSISPDKKAIYITIHVDEHGQYAVSDIRVENPLTDFNDAINKIIKTKKGDVFSRSRLLDEASQIKQYLGDHGYANALVKPLPTMNRQTHKTLIAFNIEPGKKVYVRRINFFGNDTTDTKFLRHALRQLEGSEFALNKIKESERRLANIKWIKEVHMMMDPVAGQEDMVDLNYHLKEQSSAQIMAEASFSRLTGFIYRFSFTQDNFLGTGKSASISTSRSKGSSSVNLGYVNPYFTEDGMSQSISVYRTETKPGRIAQSDYVRNVSGVNMGYGYPLSDYARAYFGLKFEYSDLIGGAAPAEEIAVFTAAHGTQFNQLEFNAGVRYNNYDNAYWPTKGLNNGFNLKYNPPIFGKSLHYYKARWALNWYKPIKHGLVFNTNASVAYGNGLGNTKVLPFFEHYYAGGIGTIAGYDSYSLGPKDSKGRSFGGNLQTLASMNLIFPNNLGDNVRTALFFNAGNVSDDHFELDELRYSVGLSLTWKSIMGPLEFVIARPIGDGPGDKTRTFDFAIGFGI